MYGKEKGAVTVFLIIVLFTTVLLGGLFIDASRVLLAKRFIRNSLDSAARSALSYYDTHLSGEYGLFAVSSETAEDAFKRYFKTNLKLARNDEFDILKMSVDDGDISVSMSGSIMTDEDLKEGFKEYSKYRSVVNTGYRLVRTFGGLFGSGGSTQKVFNAADTAKSESDKLRDDVKELSNSARNLISSGVRTQTDRLKSDISERLKNGVSPSDINWGFDQIDEQFNQAQDRSGQIDQAEEQYERMNEAQRRELENTSHGSTKYFDEESGTWRTAPAGEPDEALNKAPDGIKDIKELAAEEQSKLDQRIADARNNAEQKERKIREKGQSIETCNQEIARLSSLLETQNVQIDRIQTQLNTLESNKLKHRFAFILGDNADGELMALQQAYELAEREVELARIRGDSREEIEALEEAAKGAGEALEQGILDSGETPKHQYDDEIKELKEKQKTAKKESHQNEQSLKAQKAQRDALIGEIETLYDEIASGSSTAGSLEVPAAIDSQDKEEVAAEEDGGDGLISKMISVVQNAAHEMGKRASNPSESNLADSFDFSLSSMLEDAWGLLTEMGEMATGIVNLMSNPDGSAESFLFTDYVFSNFSFLTSQTARSTRHFRAAEVEYILKGKDFQYQNVVDVFRDIVMLRLVINFTDYMIHSKIPEITTRTLTCLGRAAVRTIKDMADMLFIIGAQKTATCSLCPSISKVKLTYSDHLWLAMALRCNNDSTRNEMIGRMKKMMEDTYQVQNWGSLYDRMTHLHGEAKVKVDLVMLTLPMFEVVLPKDNPILQNGQFLVTVGVDMGY